MPSCLPVQQLYTAARLAVRPNSVLHCRLTRTLAGCAQVKQLAWDGQVCEVCSLGGGPPAALLGALADRLLVARGSALSGTEVSARHVSLLPCLLLGWASLAACAILPGAALAQSGPSSMQTSLHNNARLLGRLCWAPGVEAYAAQDASHAFAGTPCMMRGCDENLPRACLSGGWWRARREMSALVRGYDASGVQASLLPSLTALGACDVAFALSRSQAASQARAPHAVPQAKQLTTPSCRVF